MHYIPSFVLAQAVRPVDEQTIPAVHTYTHTLQGMSSQTGRLVYSCMAQSTVQTAKEKGKTEHSMHSSLSPRQEK